MAVIGPTPAGPVPPSDRNERSPRALRNAAGKAVKGAGEIVAGADSVELDRAVHALSSNEQEDAREDHQEGAYTRDGAAAPRSAGPRIDIAG